MLKQEFERIAGEEITDEEYDIIETVYIYYPGIHRAFGKDQVAELYKTFGMRIFHDMLPRANRIMECETQILEKEAEIDDLKMHKQTLCESDGAVC